MTVNSNIERRSTIVTWITNQILGYMLPWNCVRNQLLQLTNSTHAYIDFLTCIRWTRCADWSPEKWCSSSFIAIFHSSVEDTKLNKLCQLLRQTLLTADGRLRLGLYDFGMTNNEHYTQKWRFALFRHPAALLLFPLPTHLTSPPHPSFPPSSSFIPPLNFPDTGQVYQLCNVLRVCNVIMWPSAFNI